MDKDTKTLTLRLNMDDYKALKKLCVDLDMPMTEYLRALIENDKKKREKKAAKA
jgi:hypothetical protein